MALDILKSAPRRPDRDYVSGRAGRGFGGWSFATMGLATRITLSEGKPLPHFVLHDLRRTFRTGLGKLGILPHVAELGDQPRKGWRRSEFTTATNTSREIAAALARGPIMLSDHVAIKAEGRFSEGGSA